jgi:hypothetical protein
MTEWWSEKRAAMRRNGRLPSTNLLESLGDGNRWKGWVVPGVASKRMAVSDHAPDDPWVGVSLCAKNKEGGSGVIALKNIEKLGGVFWMWPVVECQTDDFGIGTHMRDGSNQPGKNLFDQTLNHEAARSNIVQNGEVFCLKNT